VSWRFLACVCPSVCLPIIRTFFKFNLFLYVILYRFSGSIISSYNAVVSHGNSMTVDFQSDGSVTNRGFHASYQTIKGKWFYIRYIPVRMRCIKYDSMTKLAGWYLLISTLCTEIHLSLCQRFVFFRWYHNLVRSVLVWTHKQLTQNMMVVSTILTSF